MISMYNWFTVNFWSSILSLHFTESPSIKHVLNSNKIICVIWISDPKVVIIDEEGSALQDKYYEVDSTLQLSCIVRNVKMTSSAVYWSHGERILNYDVERGGIR